MNKLITYPEWLDELAEECKSCITEAGFNSRWILIEGYHQLGTIICEAYDKDKEIRGGLKMEQLVQELAVKIEKSERMLWYAVKFAKMYPQLESLPEGKNASWWQIVQKHLTDKKPEREVHVHNLERQTWDICKDESCHYKVRIN